VLFADNDLKAIEQIQTIFVYLTKLLVNPKYVVPEAPTSQDLSSRYMDIVL